MLTRRLLAFALSLTILGTTAWAVDARDDEYERSAAEITRQSQQLQRDALRNAEQVRLGQRDAEDAVEQLDDQVDIPQDAEDALEDAGIDVD